MKKEWVDKAIENSQYAREKLQEFAESYKENPETIADYLQFSQRFYEYSVKNTELIYQQNRGATFVKSYADWKKEGVSVKKGEKGIAIWVPVQVTLLEIGDDKYISLREATESQKKEYKEGKIKGTKRLRYKIGHVFDIAQTTFPKEQYPKMYDMGEVSKDKEKLIDILKTYSERELGCAVLHEDLHSIAIRGYYCNNKIVLNPNLNTTEELSTLTHEMGHAMAHNKEKDKGQGSAQKEFEADCVSIVFQSYLGEEISDTRKRHLAYNYKKYREELEKEHRVGKSEKALEQFVNEKMEENFDTVHAIMKENIQKMKKYLHDEEYVRQVKQEIDEMKKSENLLQKNHRKEISRGIKKEAGIGLEP